MKKTIENLTKAFIGESQARNRYAFYAKVAKKEGFEQIGELFLLTAANEKEHAKRIFEHIVELVKRSGGSMKELNVQAAAPVVYGTTAENLQAAIEGENYEHTEMYPEFAATAEKEGLTRVATRLRAIAVAERHHEQRYKKLLKEVKAGTVFKKDKLATWVCMECGYEHTGKEPPKVCPSCDHDRGFYQIKCEAY